MDAASTRATDSPTLEPAAVPDNRPTPRLRTEHLSVHFEDRSALEDVNLLFLPGETTALVGPNGAGKSTLLRCLGGMLAPTHGLVALDGQVVRGPSPRVAYVPQRSEVDWHFPISVLDVTLMSAALHGNRLLPVPARARDAALAALDEVGMRRFASVQIGALSGGQQQRVFIARALLQAAQVILLDEPFSGVDVPTQALVMELFDGLRATGRTIVFATHDLAMADHSADVVVLLNHRIIASGPPARVLNVPNLQTAFGGAAVLPVALGPQP